MKKNLTMRTRDFRHTLLMLFALLALVPARAADPVDLGTLELGKPYDAKMFTPLEGKFTAPATGDLIIVNNCASVFDVTASNGTDIKYVPKNYNELFGVYGQQFNYAVTEGETYTVSCASPWDNGKFVLAMDGVTEIPLVLKFSEPDLGGTINLNNKDFYFEFNQNVEIVVSRVAFVTDIDDTASWKLLTGKVNGSTVSLSSPASYGGTVQSYVKYLLEQGTCTPGQQVYIGLGNLQSESGALYVPEEDSGVKEIVRGNTTYQCFPFKVGSIPVTAVSEKVPEKFLSYWAPGNEDGMLSMTFDGELGEGAVVALGYGNMESENGYYHSLIPVVLSDDKKTLTADFTGVLRTPQTMTPLDPQTSSVISVKLYNVKDQYGNPVASPGYATVGSYDWTLPYENIPEAAVTSEFTPASGTSIKGVDELEVWISGLNSITFDGFLFSYPDEGGALVTAVVPMSEVTKTEEGSDGNVATFKFAIPASMKNQKGVTVTLNNLVSLDGYDHSTSVYGIYDTFAITSSEPANGAKLAGLDKGQEITIEINYAAQYPNMYVVYEIEDMNPEDPDQAIVKTEVWMNRQADDTYMATIPRAIQFFTGHTYRMIVTAWESEAAKNGRQEPVGTGYLLWTGTTAPYVPSSVAFVSIEPEAGVETVLPVDFSEFTVKFDGLVNIWNQGTQTGSEEADAHGAHIILGSGTSMPFKAVTPVDSQPYLGVDYANTWKLVLPDGYIATLSAPLDIAFQAVDETGRVVPGNNGKDENAMFRFTYSVPGELTDVIIETIGTEPLTSVKEFKASSGSEIAITRNYNMGDKTAYVMTAGRETVATVSDIIIPEGELGDVVTELTLVLDNEITTPGRYVLYIPEAYFYIGEELVSLKSREVYHSFEVESETPEPKEVKITTDPVQSDKATSLGPVIIMTFDDYDEVAPGSGNATLTIDGGTPEKLPDFTFEQDDAYNVLRIELGQEYTAPGTYVVTLPAGCINLGANDVIPETKLTWIIVDGNVGIETIPADGNGLYNIYMINGLKVAENVSKEELRNLGAGLYIVNGVKVIIRK